jgi:hypothetical protein
VEISHLSYTPVLSPADFFLFPTEKTALKWKRLQDVEGIKKNVTTETKADPLDVSADCFQKLFKRCNTCIEAGGDYFEYK